MSLQCVQAVGMVSTESLRPRAQSQIPASSGHTRHRQPEMARLGLLHVDSEAHQCIPTWHAI